MIYFINIEQLQSKKKELWIVLVGLNKSVIHLKIKVMILIVLKELFMEENLAIKQIVNWEVPLLMLINLNNIIKIIGLFDTFVIISELL